MRPLTTVVTPDGIGVVVPTTAMPGLPHHFRDHVTVMFADGELHFYSPVVLEVLYVPEAAA